MTTPGSQWIAINIVIVLHKIFIAFHLKFRGRRPCRIEQARAALLCSSYDYVHRPLFCSALWRRSVIKYTPICRDAHYGAFWLGVHCFAFPSIQYVSRMHLKRIWLMIRYVFAMMLLGNFSVGVIQSITKFACNSLALGHKIRVALLSRHCYQHPSPLMRYIGFLLSTQGKNVIITHNIRSSTRCTFSTREYDQTKQPCWIIHISKRIF